MSLVFRDGNNLNEKRTGFETLSFDTDYIYALCD